jgi:dienelactone hydrolase
MLWLYAEEDRYYPAAAIRRYHNAFAQAGGTATFHLFPAFGGDGHRLVDRIDLWQAAAADFLRRLNLGSRRD